MPTYTTTYSLGKPVVGADEDAWGDTLNASLDSIDDILDGTTPVTGIDINSGTLDGVTIGGTTAGAGTFTTLTANTSITGTLATAAQPNVTSLGTLTSLTVSGDVSFGDNDKAIFGAGSDLQIYHSGSHSYIDEVGTGSLLIRAEDLVFQNSDGSENYGRALANGAFELNYDAVRKLATTNTGVDITGTLTSDGLTVQGSGVTAVVEASASNAGLRLSGLATNAGARNWDIRSNNAAFGDLVFLQGASQGATPSVKRMSIDVNGDISFYEDTGTTAKFFWDASAERLGIGTSSPSVPLEVASSGSSVLQITSGTNTSQSALYFADPDDGNVGLILYDHTSNYMSFRTNGSGEDMRIDSSGNLLVGKTAIGNDVGAEFRSIGYSSFTRDGNNVLTVRRKTSDGDIVQFEKDTTVVGSIGSISSNPYFASGSVGLKLTTEVLPCDNNGAAADGFLDLGGTSNRFNNLYLSGGVYLGGTGPANKLDDYEAGTFTPTAFGSAVQGTTTYSFQYGYYTKVGDICHVTIFVSWTAMTGSGNLEIGGLPFTVSSGTQYYSVASVLPSQLNWGGGTYLTGLGKNGVSRIAIYYAGDDANAATQAVVNETANLRISMSYKVA